VSLPSLHQKVEIELTELQTVVSEVKRLLDKIQSSQDYDYLGAVAMNLQSFYTGAERIFLLIAREIDQYVPSGERWHLLLLEQMGSEVPSIRPLLLDEDSRLALDELRRFRHVARSLYAYRLNPELTQVVANQLPEVERQLEENCERFFECLQR
jgi:hypothetical protein